MKYILMMHAPYGTGDYELNRWSSQDRDAHMAFMYRLNRELTESGELVSVQALGAAGQAKVVRAGKKGVPAITDGPFPEAKEFLAGYWIVDVERPERAYAIAAKASEAPGPGGAPLIIPIEVRNVIDIPRARS